MPELQPIDDMGIQDPSLDKLLAREVQLQSRLEGLSFHKDGDRDEQLKRYTRQLCMHSQALPTHVFFRPNTCARRFFHVSCSNQVYGNTTPCRQGEAFTQGGERCPAHGNERRGTGSCGDQRWRLRLFRSRQYLPFGGEYSHGQVYFSLGHI